MITSVGDVNADHPPTPKSNRIFRMVWTMNCLCPYGHSNHIILSTYNFIDLDIRPNCASKLSVPILKQMYAKRTRYFRTIIPENAMVFPNVNVRFTVVPEGLISNRKSGLEGMFRGIMSPIFRLKTLQS